MQVTFLKHEGLSQRFCLPKLILVQFSQKVQGCCGRDPQIHKEHHCPVLHLVHNPAPRRKRERGKTSSLPPLCNWVCNASSPHGMKPQPPIIHRQQNRAIKIWPPSFTLCSKLGSCLSVSSSPGPLAKVFFISFHLRTFSQRCWALPLSYEYIKLLCGSEDPGPRPFRPPSS